MSEPALQAAPTAACALCNAAVYLDALQSAGRICTGCGATRQSMELAEALLASVGRGCHPFLSRLAFEEPMRSARVLDLSGDLALGHALWVVDGYRAGRQYRDVPEGHLLARFDHVDLFAQPPGSVDVLILRDALLAAEDLAATLSAVGRILAPGGCAVLQDRFAWPVPAETTAASAGRTRPAAGGITLAERNVVGADIVDMLAARGMAGEFHRPNLGIDPLFRAAILTASKLR